MSHPSPAHHDATVSMMPFYTPIPTPPFPCFHPQAPVPMLASPYYCMHTPVPALPSTSLHLYPTQKHIIFTFSFSVKLEETST